MGRRAACTTAEALKSGSRLAARKIHSPPGPSGRMRGSGYRRALRPAVPPYGAMPGYGYQPYGPNPMMIQPVQYYPPMQRAPAPMYYEANTAPRIYNFGPLP